MATEPEIQRKPESSSGPVRVGVVGVGHWGRKHAVVYNRLPGAILAGVCDLDPERGEGVAAELGVGFFPALDGLLPAVDCLSVTVPTNAHFQVAAAAIKAGIHVLVEKPLARSLEEADELVRLAAAGDRLLQVGHLERFNPAYQFLLRSVESPRFIESHRLAEFRPLAGDVSVVLDLMTHDIDLILSLVKAELEDVQAVGVPVLTDKEDITNARLTFSDGCIANVTASRVSQGRVRKLRVFERNRYFSADLVSGIVETISPRPADPGVDGEKMPLDYQLHDLSPVRPLDAELEDFIGNVAGNGRPLVDGPTGRRTLAVALEVLRKTGAEG